MFSKKKTVFTKEMIKDGNFDKFVIKFNEFLEIEAKEFIFFSNVPKHKDIKHTKNKLLNKFFSLSEIKENYLKHITNKIDFNSIFVTIAKELFSLYNSFKEKYEDRIEDNDETLVPEQIIMEIFYDRETKISNNFLKENFNKTFIISAMHSLFFCKEFEIIENIQSKENNLIFFSPLTIYSLHLLLKLKNSLKKEKKNFDFFEQILLNLIYLSIELYENCDIKIFNYTLEKNLLKYFIEDLSSNKIYRKICYQFFIEFNINKKDRISYAIDYFHRNKLFEILLSSTSQSFFNEEFNNSEEFFDEIIYLIMNFIIYEPNENNLKNIKLKRKNSIIEKYNNEYSLFKDKIIHLLVLICNKEFKKQKNKFLEIFDNFIDNLLMLDYIKTEDLKPINFYEYKLFNLYNFKEKDTLLRTIVIEILISLPDYSNLDNDLVIIIEKIVYLKILEEISFKNYNKIKENTKFLKSLIKKMFFNSEDIILKFFRILFNLKKDEVKDEINLVLSYLNRISEETILDSILSHVLIFLNLNPSYDQIIINNGKLFFDIKNIFDTVLIKHGLMEEEKEKKHNSIKSNSPVINTISSIKSEHEKVIYSNKMLEKLLDFIETLLKHNINNFKLLEKTGILDNDYYIKFSMSNDFEMFGINFKVSNVYRNITYKIWGIEMVYDYEIDSNSKIFNNFSNLSNLEKSANFINNRYKKIKNYLVKFIKNENKENEISFENSDDIILNYLNEINLINEVIGKKLFKEKKTLTNIEEDLHNILIDFSKFLSQIYNLKKREKKTKKFEMAYDEENNDSSNCKSDEEKSEENNSFNESINSNESESKYIFLSYIQKIIKTYLLIIFDIISHYNMNICSLTFKDNLDCYVFEPISKTEFNEIFKNLFSLYKSEEKNSIYNRLCIDLIFFLFIQALKTKYHQVENNKILRISYYDSSQKKEFDMNLAEDINLLDEFLNIFKIKKMEVVDEAFSDIYIYSEIIVIDLINNLFENELFAELDQVLQLITFLCKNNINNIFLLLKNNFLKILAKIALSLFEKGHMLKELETVFNLFGIVAIYLDNNDLEDLFIFILIMINNKTFNEKDKFEYISTILEIIAQSINKSKKTKRKIILTNFNLKQPNLFNLLYSSNLNFVGNNNEQLIYYYSNNEKVQNQNLSILINLKFHGFDEENKFNLFNLEKNVKEKNINILNISIINKKIVAKDFHNNNNNILSGNKIEDFFFDNKDIKFLIKINKNVNLLEIYLNKKIYFQTDQINLSEIDLNDVNSSYNFFIGYTNSNIKEYNSNKHAINYVAISYILIYVGDFSIINRELFSLSKISSSMNGSIKNDNIFIKNLNKQAYKILNPNLIGSNPNSLKIDLEIDSNKVIYELIVEKKIEILKFSDFDNLNFIKNFQNKSNFDIKNKYLLLYLKNTNFFQPKHIEPFNNNTFLVNKSGIFQNLLLNTIYNIETIQNEAIKMFNFSNNNIYDSMNQFDFISFCFVLLNDCKNIYDDEINTQIFFKCLKLFSLYLIYNLDKMRNFINSDKFRILIILLIKNFLLIDESCLELIFYLSYAQEKIDDEISSFEPWFPEFINDVLLNIEFFKKMTESNQKFIITNLKFFIKPASNEPNYDFKVAIIQKLYIILLIVEMPQEIDNMIIELLFYIIDQIINYSTELTPPNNNHIKDVIDISILYLRITNNFSTSISTPLSNRNLNSEELDETRNFVKSIFSKIFDEITISYREKILNFFKKYIQDYKNIIMDNNKNKDPLKSSDLSYDKAKRLYFELQLFNKLDEDEENVSDEKGIYTKLSEDFYEVEVKPLSLEIFLKYNVQFEIEDIKNFFAFQKFLKYFYYNIRLIYGERENIEKYLNKDLGINFSFYLYNREGPSRIKNKIILKSDLYSNQEMTKAFYQNSKSNNKKIKLKRFQSITQFQQKFFKDIATFFKINSRVKKIIWLDQIFKIRVIGHFLDKNDQIESAYNCLYFKGINYYTSVFIIGKNKFYLIKNCHIDKENILYMNKRATNNLSQTDCFQKIFWTLDHYENILEEHCQFLDINKVKNEDDSDDEEENGTISKELLKYSFKRNQIKIYYFNYLDINEIHKRKFLYQNNSLEIFFKNGKNFFFAFNRDKRDLLFSQLLVKLNIKIRIKKNQFSFNIGNMGICGNNNIVYLRKSKIFTKKGKNKDKTQKSLKDIKTILTKSQNYWSIGYINNYDYIMILNTLAGRTYNDFAQYPIFPWIIKDYSTPTISLDQDIYRDLTYPIFAQDQKKREELLLKYDDGNEDAYFSGTHFSTPGFVTFFLIRMKPFANMASEIQGGYFDTPDRLFGNIKIMWNLDKYQEFIPELYYLPEAFRNFNNFDFGQTQIELKVNDVILPDWAQDDPRLFVKMNKKALESTFVCTKISDWIDLIFGNKQTGKEAKDFFNIYRKACYPFDVITEIVKQKSISKGEEINKILMNLEIIMNEICEMGQNPTQLFQKSHPKKERNLKNKAFFGNLKFLLNFNYDENKLEKIYLPFEEIENFKGFYEIDDINISKGEGGLSSFRIIIPENDEKDFLNSKKKLQQNLNSLNTFFISGKKTQLIGPKFKNYIDYNYNNYSFFVIKPFDFLVLEFQTHENSPISILKITNDGKYIFIGFENGKINKYKLKKIKTKKIYHPDFNKKNKKKRNLSNEKKQPKIIRKDSTFTKIHNNSVDKINRKATGNNSSLFESAEIAKKNSKKDKNEIRNTSSKGNPNQNNIVMYRDNNQYVSTLDFVDLEELDNNYENGPKKISEKIQLPEIYFVNQNYTEKFHNYYVYKRNDKKSKTLEKDISKGTKFFVLTKINVSNYLQNRIVNMEISEKFGIIIIEDSLLNIFTLDIYSLKIIHFFNFNKITKSTDNKILAIKISQDFGDFVICTPTKIALFSINSVFLAIEDLSEEIKNNVTGKITCFEIKNIKITQSDLFIFTGHSNGQITIWRINTNKNDEENFTDSKDEKNEKKNENENKEKKNSEDYLKSKSNKTEKTYEKNVEFIDAYKYSLDLNYYRNIQKENKKIYFKMFLDKMEILKTKKKSIKFIKISEDLTTLFVINCENFIFCFSYEDYIESIKKKTKSSQNCPICGTNIGNSRIFCQICNKKLCPKCDRIYRIIPESTLKTKKIICSDCNQIIASTNKMLYDF